MTAYPPLPRDLARLKWRALGVAYRVHSELGPSMKEDVYRRCVVHSLRKEGLRVDTRKRISIVYDDLVLANAIELDVLVENRVLLELKARDAPAPVWDAQVLSYLWHTKVPLGFLINFHVTHLRQGIRPFYNLPRHGVGDTAPSPSSPSSQSSPTAAPPALDKP